MEKEKSAVIELINKEDIANYKVVRAPEDRSEELRTKLSNALRLGNEFKSKCSIAFQTTEGAKRIETTVWTLTDSYLQIKNGVVIPLNSLIDVTY
jgi:HKD family nuclease